jgi:hypothetical protein
MIVNDLDVESVAVRELETQTPAPIDRHRPLIPPASLQLVKPDAPQITEFGEICCGIESGE